MPMYRRLPKRGFNNIFSKAYSEVNVGRIQQAVDAGKIDAKAKLDAAALVDAGVITKLEKDGVRLLGNGELKAAIEISVAGASKGPSQRLKRLAARSTSKKPKKRPAKPGRAKPPQSKHQPSWPVRGGPPSRW